MKKIIFLFLTLLILFSSCGGATYTTGIDVYITDINNNPIQGIKCSLIERDTGKVIRVSFSNENGIIQFGIPVYENIFTTVITNEEVVANYKVLIEDIDGMENGGDFKSVEYYPIATTSGTTEEDFQVILILKN